MPIAHLTKQHEATLRAILDTYFHDMPVTVFLFGSRVGQAYRPDSDLDLLIEAQGEIPLSTLARLKEDFEESDLPFRVDVVLKTDMAPGFYQRIQEDLVPLGDFRVTG